MARRLPLLCLFLALASLAAAQSIPVDEFAARRGALRARVGDEALILIPGRTADSYPEPVGPRADNSSWYLTGIRRPGHLVVLLPGESVGSLFVTEASGVEPGKAAARRLGFAAVYWLHELELVLSTNLGDEGPKRLVSPSVGGGLPIARGPDDLEAAIRKIVETYPDAERASIFDDVVALRLKKSPAEQACLEKAAEITNRGQVEAFALAGPGVDEADVEYVLEERWRLEGTADRAFGSIVGGGAHSTIIHYMDNDAPIEAGGLVVVDVGAEWEGYAADCTRTFPIDGRFTERQREIYELVLEAHDACERALEPGVSLADLHRIASEVIDGAGYGRYFTHALGHYVGLHVHDPGSMRRALEPGMVITIEPGIYIRAEGLGVRIEDTYIVTEEGFRRITDGIGRTIDEVEALAGSALRLGRTLGVSGRLARGEDLDMQLAPVAAHGLLVDEVAEGSIAAAIGFEVGDLLVEVAGRPVGLAAAELAAFLEAAPGTRSLLCDVLREGHRRALLALGDDVASDFPVEAWRTITATEMKEHVVQLAGPEFAGRGTGQEGLEKAEAYLAARFEELGLRPGGVEETWFQSFALNQRSLDGPATVTLGDRTFERGSDFQVFPFSGAGDLADLPVVFAGYGISQPAEGYDDYADIDVKGKVVLVLRHAPPDREGEASLPPSAGYFFVKHRTALRHGAVAMLLVNPPSRPDAEPIRYGFPAISGFAGPGEPQVGKVPALFVTHAMADAIVAASGRDLADVQRAIDAERKPVAFEVPDVRLGVSVPMTARRTEVDNVIGVLEGSDPVLKEELVVLGAHYDHEGVIDGDIFPGADDNASGTTTILEVAEAFASLPPAARPQRTLVFMLFAAEEKGLLGSIHTTDEPVVALDRIACMINMDMVGRAVDSSVAAGGARLSTHLEDLCLAANRLDARQVQLGPDRPSEISRRSDHYSFYRKGIPVLYFKASKNPEYHTPADTVDKITFGRLERVGRYIFHVAWRVANMPERPTIRGE